MKVGIKNKSEMKFINVEDMRVGDVSLGELANIIEEQNNIMIEFFEHMKGQHLVSKDTPYIIKLNDKLVEIDKLEIVAVEKLKYPLRMYDLIDGELILNKKKVVAL